MQYTGSFLEVALEAAQRAEEIILPYFQSNVASSNKQDGSPVTEADQKAERVIREVISVAFPDHGFLGEEYGVTLEGSEYIWIIDPIDGTKEFIAGMPLFATQIALVHKGEIILGVSNAPILHEKMYAEKGKGAFLNGKPLRVSDVSTLGEAYALTGGLKYFANRNFTDAIAKLATNAKQHRIFGGFWSYHLLAQGKVECMIEVDTNFYDIAAVAIIVQEAGGKISTLDGQPITFENQLDLIASNGRVHDQATTYFI